MPNRLFSRRFSYRIVDYDLMEDNTADPLYLEYILQRKAYLQYKLIDYQAELTECFTNNEKMTYAVNAQIQNIDNLQFHGDLRGTGQFKVMLHRLEALKGIMIDSDRITDAVEYRLKDLEVEIAKLEVEVEYNEKMVDEAEGR